MEAVELEPEVLSLSAQAKSLVVKDAGQYSGAGNLWNVIKDMRAKIAETFDPIIKKAHEAHKEAVAQKKRHDDPLDLAQKTIKQRMIAYDQEQERIRRAEQLRLEAEAKKKAEEEALELAELMEQAGLNGVAEEVLAEPVQVAPVVVPKATPRVEGFTYRSNWTFRIVDESKIPREYMAPDLTKIGKIVRALKQEAKIPGIEVVEEKV